MTGVLVSGSCTYKNGIGRLSSPTCRDTTGAEGSFCTSTGVTLSGWACSSDPPEVVPGDIETVAVCCTATSTRLLLGFDDIATPGLSGNSDPLNVYRGFTWGDVLANNGATYNAFIGGCGNGFVNGVVSQPNTLFTSYVGSLQGSMTAPPGQVFAVSSLKATAAWANNVPVMFTGFDGQGTVLGRVNATLNQTGPVAVDLTSLGRISTLQFESISCGQDAPGSCFTAFDACSDGRTGVIVDDIDVAGECCLMERLSQRAAATVPTVPKRLGFRTQLADRVNWDAALSDRRMLSNIQ